MFINEIFMSFSGEGKSTGELATFVRTAGCNFLEEFNSPCRYPCDTKYALKTSDGKDMDIDEIIREVRKYPTNFTILTGGEPLYSSEAKELLSRLYVYGFRTETITNGSLPIWPGHKGVWSVDIKCLSSGNSKYNLYSNLKLLRERDQIKFVVSDRADFDFALKVVHDYPCRAIKLFQPAWDKIDPKELVEWMKKDAIWGRLSMQVQKYVYGPMIRGV